MSTVQQSNEVLYTALELSNQTWKLGFSNGRTMRERNICARDGAARLREVARAKERLGPLPQAPVVSSW